MDKVYAQLEFENDAGERTRRVVECLQCPEWAIEGAMGEATRTKVWIENRKALRAVRLDMIGRGWREVRA